MTVKADALRGGLRPALTVRSTGRWASEALPLPPGRSLQASTLRGRLGVSRSPCCPLFPLGSAHRAKATRQGAPRLVAGRNPPAGLRGGYAAIETTSPDVERRSRKLF